MKLIVLPEDGISRIVLAIKRAKKTVDIVIFRSDIPEIEQALIAAVDRGISTRALIAHTNRGGDKKLRTLEGRLLKAGVTLSRTDDDMVRYHGKMLLIDRQQLFVLGFNYTRLDITKSRSFGVSTRNRQTVQDAFNLLEADHNRRPFVPTSRDLVISPENTRSRLGAFISRARKQLLIYDPCVSDDAMIRLLKERANAGVGIRILGTLEKKWQGPAFQVAPLARHRLHVRVIIRDGKRAFIGSQSLRKMELDQRREVGLMVRDRATVRRLVATFEADWVTSAGRAPRTTQ